MVRSGPEPMVGNAADFLSGGLVDRTMHRWLMAEQ